MKKFLVLLLVVTMAASFVYAGGQKEEMSSEPMISGAYVPGQTETAYAYTHGGYVGMAKVMTDDNGDLSVMLDETFLPHTLAIVDIEAAEWTENNTVEFDSHGPAFAAKYVEYDGKVYVGVVTGATFSYVEADDAGMPKGNTDLEKAILRNQGTMAAYTALAKAGGFKTFTKFGGTATAITTTSYGAVNKRDAAGYWGGADRKTTWASNMAAIEAFIAENGVQFNEADMKRASEENAEGLKVWSVADAVSGATNSDFKDYFGMAQHAAGKLKTN